MTAQNMIPLAIVFLLPCAGFAQTRDPGKLLGQSPETGSLPLWSSPTSEARKSLGQHARDAERGIFLVGVPKQGTGTAWVISRKHRLLVTNAHVADLYHNAGNKLFAIPSGTSQVYSVEKIWYHPGVRRYFKGGDDSVRSQNPKDGDIDTNCPDLALLKLSDDGPELPVEFPIASPEELANLFAQPVAIMGFPGTDTIDMPGLGEKAASTFHDGIISRLTNFFHSPSAPPEELLLAQYTIPTWGGFSGSPIFLTSGKVGVIHNSSRTVKRDTGKDNLKEVRSIAHGIRADCVLEMIVFHGLEKQMSFAIDKSKVLVDRWIKADPQTDRARVAYTKASEVHEEAFRTIYVKKDYKKGIQICTEALKIFPYYSEAYYDRGNCYQDLWSSTEDIPKETALKLLDAAQDDFLAYSKLRPESATGPLSMCSVWQAIAYETNDKSLYERALSVATKISQSDNVTKPGVLALAHSVMGRSFMKLGDMAAAEREFNESIRLDPLSPEYYIGRAKFWKRSGRPDLERADRARADELYALRSVIGMKILDVTDGGAAHKAGLRPGDIITHVGEKRTRSFEELSTALAGVIGRVDLKFKRGENAKSELISIKPVDGRIGVTVEAIQAK